MCRNRRGEKAISNQFYFSDTHACLHMHTGDGFARCMRTHEQSHKQTLTHLAHRLPEDLNVDPFKDWMESLWISPPGPVKDDVSESRNTGIIVTIEGLLFPERPG